MTTPLLKQPELSENQASKFVTHNEALRIVEIFAAGRVLSRTNGGPPGSPAEGDAYIVDDASGDWSSFALDDVAWFQGGAWKALTPFEGLGALWVSDEDVAVSWDGTTWTAAVSLLSLKQQSSDPPDPAAGESTIWHSDGTGSGADGDIMVKITDSAGTTKTVTLIDFSAN